jgi:uncharacterized protein YpmS
MLKIQITIEIENDKNGEPKIKVTPINLENIPLPEHKEIKKMSKGYKIPN